MALLIPFMAALLLLSSTSPVRAAVGVGDTLPSLSVVDAAGARVELEFDTAGVVAVEFWASWCIACRHTLPALARLARERGVDGFRAIAVNIDRSRQAADDYRADNDDVSWEALRLVYDPGGEALAELGAPGLPALYLIEDGAVRLLQGGWRADGDERLRDTVDALLRRR